MPGLSGHHVAEATAVEQIGIFPDCGTLIYSTSCKKLVIFERHCDELRSLVSTVISPTGSCGRCFVPSECTAQPQAPERIFHVFFLFSRVKLNQFR